MSCPTRRGVNTAAMALGRSVSPSGRGSSATSAGVSPGRFTTTSFDFAVCSHTLEDVRDPIWVCSELNRIARAGYIEVPSRLDEQTLWIQGPWVGWGHHHWFIDIEDDRLDFVFKTHVVNGRQSTTFRLTS